MDRLSTPSVVPVFPPASAPRPDFASVVRLASRLRPTRRLRAHSQLALLQREDVSWPTPSTLLPCRSLLWTARIALPTSRPAHCSASGVEPLPATHWPASVHVRSSPRRRRPCSREHRRPSVPRPYITR